MGSSGDHFYSGSSTVAGIQESLSSTCFLGVVDDLESRKKEEQLALLDYEGARTQTVSGGARTRVAPLLITLNPEAEDKPRQEKQVTGRCVVVDLEHAPYPDPPNSLQALGDLVGISSVLRDEKKPFDFLMKKFHQLYFTKVDIPDDLKEGIQEIETISADGEQCSLYILILAQTCQVQTKVFLIGWLPTCWLSF